MILLDHPNSVLRGNNKLTVEYLNQVQKCVEKLDEMGLTVTNIHFERIKPTVRVKTCTQTKTLQKNKQAICFIKGNDGERFNEFQMLVEGIRVIWRDYLH
ncbi:hypothetical protein ACT2CV_08085 [Pasteurellaceae bacterium 22721_9_1]